MLHRQMTTSYKLLRKAAINRRNTAHPPHLMTYDDIERMAARRLVEKGLLAHTFPGAGPGHPMRRYYHLTKLAIEQLPEEWR